MRAASIAHPQTVQPVYFTTQRHFGLFDKLFKREEKPTNPPVEAQEDDKEDFDETTDQLETAEEEEVSIEEIEARDNTLESLAEKEITDDVYDKNKLQESVGTLLGKSPKLVGKI